MAELRGAGQHLAWITTDATTAWSIRFGQLGFDWSHTLPPKPDAAVEAKAGELLLFVYGRRGPSSPGVAASGDPEVVDLWVSNSSI